MGENVNSKCRMEYLDVCKGLAIIIVVVQHAITNEPFIFDIDNISLLRFITLFTMPTFFFINGFLFSEKYFEHPVQGIWKKFKAYYIPFVKFNLFFLIIHNLCVYVHFLNEQYGNSYYNGKLFLKHFILAITGHRELFAGALWFLGSLIIITTVFIIAENISSRIFGGKFKYVILTLIIVFIALLGCLRLVPDSMKIRRSFTDIVFFYVGFLIRHFNLKRYMTKYGKIYGIISFIIFIVISQFCSVGISAIGWSYITYYIVGILGAIMLLQISKFKIWEKVSIIGKIGKASMYIMALHLLAFKFVSIFIVFLYGMDKDRIAEYPVIMGISGYWWLVYTLFGVGIPFLYYVIKERVSEKFSAKYKVGRKINKFVEYITTKFVLLVKQQKYIQDGVKYKYIFRKRDNDKLIVVLSSCTRKGIKARYNYMRTLKDVDASQLFILDDFAKDHRGSYYIGRNFKFNEEQVVIGLISKYVQEYGIKKLIFCGSSKGGWSALNLGLNFPNANLVVGGPQYYLGDYLIKSGNLDTLDYIIGDRSEDKINTLNIYLKNKIYKNPYKDTQKIYIHFSDKEHTYSEHIKDLLDDLISNKYCVESDIASYENHSEISYYFPEFLIKSINRILSE